VPTVTVASPLRVPAFRWFFAGRLVSLLGSSMTSVALAFAVLDASGSAGDLGIVLGAHSVPLLTFLLLGGAVADRFSRSAVLVASHLGAGLTQGAMAALLISGRYDLGTVAALSALNGTLQAFTSPALRGIVPQLVKPAAIQRANSLLATTRNASRILGPSVAGVLVATVGGGWAVAADAASYLLAALCLARLRLPGRVATAPSTILADIRTGWHAFRGTTWLWTVTAAFSLTNVVQAGVWGVLGPTIARATFGEAPWGLVLSARAVGLLLMGLVMYRVVTTRLLRLGQLSAALIALPLVALGLGVPVPWLVGAAFVAGLGSAVVTIAWETSLQEHVPPHLLSRVSSYDDLGSFIGVPVGQVAIGPVAAALGDSRVVVVGGLACLVVTLLPLATRSVRNLPHAP
jgi:MFS family permease